MARVDTLGHFLTDVADAIRAKKGSSDTIQASDFDTEIENLPSGGDPSEYFGNTIGFGGDISSGLNRRIIGVPMFTVEGFSLNYAFYGCRALVNVPLLDTSNITMMDSCFSDCQNLSDDSLNNILRMCINATKYSRSQKTLVKIGLSKTYYPASRIQALPNYADFIAAGWTIGY